MFLSVFCGALQFPGSYRCFPLRRIVLTIDVLFSLVSSSVIRGFWWNVAKGNAPFLLSISPPFENFVITEFFSFALRGGGPGFLFASPPQPRTSVEVFFFPLPADFPSVCLQCQDHEQRPWWTPPLSLTLTKAFSPPKYWTPVFSAIPMT